MKDVEVLEVKDIYRGRIVGLTVEKIRLPDGRETHREVVHHPGAVAIVPCLTPDEVVLIRQFRYAVGEVLWEIPAGTIEPGETPEDCAAREVEEETGYRAGKIEKLAQFYTAPGFCTETMHMFRATDLEKTQQDLEDDEEVEVRTVPLPEALRMIRAGTIVDAKTIVGLMLHGAGS